MATFTTEDITTRTRRWIIPAAEPRGACIGDVSDATAAACRAYREAHGLEPHTVIPDDAIRFHPRDDVIVIEFSIEEPQP